MVPPPPPPSKESNHSVSVPAPPPGAQTSDFYPPPEATSLCPRSRRGRWILLLLLLQKVPCPARHDLCSAEQRESGKLMGLWACSSTATSHLLHQSPPQSSREANHLLSPPQEPITSSILHSHQSPSQPPIITFTATNHHLHSHQSPPRLQGGQYYTLSSSGTTGESGSALHALLLRDDWWRRRAKSSQVGENSLYLRTGFKARDLYITDSPHVDFAAAFKLCHQHPEFFIFEQKVLVFSFCTKTHRWSNPVRSLVGCSPWGR